MYVFILEVNGLLMYEMICLNFRIILWNGRIKVRLDYIFFDFIFVKIL